MINFMFLLTIVKNITKIINCFYFMIFMFLIKVCLIVFFISQSLKFKKTKTQKTKT